MTNDKIHAVININDYTLIVFYTNARCWQFRVISPGGDVYGSTGIFYTADAAETAGRDWVGKKG
ncbi:hypothetical protein [Brunnivagina elsteri]|uniref:DUF1508 domain-containing protein n=1 Tax=Brunnivagina elsteri CCALA 953 TaxID=987040 RepID=A0A2A2TJL2_9CYAN|nr:hypothetical protein [Calothrix elsteri]PAX54878.1 hypothetical protein CK510_11870 [Calothrix elsteri CCALA 953]